MRQVVLIAIGLMLVAADAFYANNAHVEPESLVLPLTMALGGFALLFSVRDRTDAATLGRWRNRALLLLFTLTIALAFAEAATRVIFRDVTTSSDNQGYFTRRWAGTGAVQTNGAGFRERSFSDVKAPGTYRIVAVGDSFTYGNGIRNDERYTEILQKGLPDSFEVLNFGTAGANTPQHLDTIANVVLPLQTRLRDSAVVRQRRGGPRFHRTPHLPFAAAIQRPARLADRRVGVLHRRQHAMGPVAGRSRDDADLCGLSSPADGRSRTDRMRVRIGPRWWR